MAGHGFRWSVLTLMAVVSATAVGCIDGGVLVTPVSTRRDLVEEQLYRESRFARDKIAIIDVSGMPVGAALNQGTDNGDGSWTLTPPQLAALTITVPDDAVFTLTVAATATEDERRTEKQYSGKGNG